MNRRLRTFFHSALISDGVCYGALLFDETKRDLDAVCADAVVMAAGGQNALFGKTTGSTQCDGYAAGKLFLQGADLKNLEFIQYHPTTLETAHKRMLISEAVRGEGGRLFYVENGERVYFMENKYGPGGNLMTRDVISREMDAVGQDIFLDISFLDRKTIDQRLPEVRDICLKYRGIDISKAPIPVAPSVHFFMGGLAVHLNHETNIRNLFAIGECASIYHGANRLGGNSLLAALHSSKTAADEIADRESAPHCPDFSAYTKSEQRSLMQKLSSQSPFPAFYIRDMLAETMRKRLGIVREGAGLEKGIEEIDYDISIVDRISYDGSVSPYVNYSLTAILTAARATLTCAMFRKESRGAHYRSDHQETDASQQFATIISYDNGQYNTYFDREQFYES